MARTFGVRSANPTNRFIENNQNANPLSNQADFLFTTNRVMSDLLDEPEVIKLDREEVISIEGQLPAAKTVADAPVNAGPTAGVRTPITDPMNPTSKTSSYYDTQKQTYERSAADKETTRQMKGALVAMETASGLR